MARVNTWTTIRQTGVQVPGCRRGATDLVAVVMAGSAVPRTDGSYPWRRHKTTSPSRGDRSGARPGPVHRFAIQAVGLVCKTTERAIGEPGNDSRPIGLLAVGSPFAAAVK